MAHRGQSVEEVFPETAFGHGAGHVDIGRGHDPDVGLLHLGGAYFDVFTGLEDAQQARLGGQRQLGHLVEEDGAPVGLLEVSLAGGDRSGEGSFLMAEQLGVDGALGYRAAVDGDVFGVFAR